MMAEYFDATYIVTNDLEHMLTVKIPITLLTDSESLFKIIVSFTTTTTKKRLMSYVRATRATNDRG